MFGAKVFQREVGFRCINLNAVCSADALVSTGLAAKGYTYVNIGIEVENVS